MKNAENEEKKVIWELGPNMETKEGPVAGPQRRTGRSSGVVIWQSP